MSGRNGVQFELAHVVFRSGKFNAIDGRVVKPRFCAANLHVLAFTLIALQAYARHSANDVGDVFVRQALNDALRHYIQDIVGSALLVDVLGYAERVRHNCDFFSFGLDLKHGIHASGLAGDHLHIRCVRQESQRKKL